MRFRSTAWARATFAPEKKLTTAGENTMPRMLMTAATKASVQNSRLAKSQTFSLLASCM